MQKRKLKFPSLVSECQWMYSIHIYTMAFVYYNSLNIKYRQEVNVIFEETLLTFCYKLDCFGNFVTKHSNANTFNVNMTSTAEHLL